MYSPSLCTQRHPITHCAHGHNVRERYTKAAANLGKLRGRHEGVVEGRVKLGELVIPGRIRATSGCRGGSRVGIDGNATQQIGPGRRCCGMARRKHRLTRLPPRAAGQLGLQVSLGLYAPTCDTRGGGAVTVLPALSPRLTSEAREAGGGQPYLGDADKAEAMASSTVAPWAP